MAAPEPDGEGSRRQGNRNDEYTHPHLTPPIAFSRC